MVWTAAAKPRVAGRRSTAQPLPDIAHGEAVRIGILGIDDVRGEARDPGSPGKSGNDGPPVADGRLLDEASGEHRAKDALVPEVLVQPESALRVQHGHPGTGARATGRPIDNARPGRGPVPVELPGRNGDDIAAVIVRIVGRSRQLGDGDATEARLV